MVLKQDVEIFTICDDRAEKIARKTRLNEFNKTQAVPGRRVGGMYVYMKGSKFSDFLYFLPHFSVPNSRNLPSFGQKLANPLNEDVIYTSFSME